MDCLANESLPSKATVVVVVRLHFQIKKARWVYMILKITKLEPDKKSCPWVNHSNRDLWALNFVIGQYDQSMNSISCAWLHAMRKRYAGKPFLNHEILRSRTFAFSQNGIEWHTAESYSDVSVNRLFSWETCDKLKMSRTMRWHLWRWDNHYHLWLC